MKSIIDGGRIVITGASSGIGREVARLVAPRARALVLVARREARLVELREELQARYGNLAIEIEVCDLSERAASLALAERLCEHEVDVLVNNAGIGDLGVFDRTDLQRQLGMLELNVASLVILTHALVQGMVRRKRGAVLNVSSGFGLSFLPGFSGYIGTKYFVTGFTEALRLELTGTGVTAGQVCPGPVATEFEANIGNFTGDSVPSVVEISAERCAGVVVRAIDDNRALVVTGVLTWLAITIGNALPKFLVRWVLGPIGRAMRKRQEAADARG